MTPNHQSRTWRGRGVSERHKTLQRHKAGLYPAEEHQGSNRWLREGVCGAGADRRKAIGLMPVRQQPKAAQCRCRTCHSEIDEPALALPGSRWCAMTGRSKRHEFQHSKIGKRVHSASHHRFMTAKGREEGSPVEAQAVLAIAELQTALPMRAEIDATMKNDAAHRGGKGRPAMANRAARSAPWRHRAA